MFNTLFGLYIAEKFGARSDRILWDESVDASGTSDLTLTNAINGASLKSDLASLNYLITKYTTWTTNGIVQIELKPDAEAVNQLKTYSLFQKTESPLIPPKLVESDITLKLTNKTGIPDDVTIILDILKIPQGKVPQVVDLFESMVIAPEHVDIQTLAIEKYLIQTNKLLEALVTANNGTLPTPIQLEPTPTKKELSCKRI